MGGLYFNISYGSKNYYTPFSIKLRDFQLERYPGSMSPSSFAAEVTVKDGKVNEDHRIFMNTVLDYRGYRFFQSSYDQDELGTILSVNHDLLGTLVSYLGYFLLALGMITVFFTSKTRFAFLNKQLIKIKSKAALLTAALFLSINVTADTNLDSVLNANTINVEHIKNFEKLLIQDNGGRIKPVNTICSEFLRKIARKSKIAEQNPTQIVVGMMKNPKLWSNVPMIKISHDKLKLLLQTEESRVSFRTFFSEDGDYILKDEVDRVNSKAPIDRDKYDKDIIQKDFEPGLAVRGDEDIIDMNYIQYLEVDTFELSSTSTSIDNNNLDLKFSIYPNPANNNLTLDFTSENSDKSILSITSIIGEKIREFQINTVICFLSDVLFSLKLTSDNEKLTLTFSIKFFSR